MEQCHSVYTSGIGANLNKQKCTQLICECCHCNRTAKIIDSLRRNINEHIACFDSHNQAILLLNTGK